MHRLRDRICFTLLSALAAAYAPEAARAQAAGGPQMTPAETEAHQMSLEMSFVCNPQRHRSMPESESMIRRQAGDLPGTAAHLRTAEGTFLVLEAYDENQSGHCLVLGWFGGDVEPGSHTIRQLSMAAMENEVDTGEHSFFTFSAVRSPTESATLVTDGGSIEIVSAEQGTVVGTFQLTGFTVSSQARVDGIALEGSFTALERDP